MGGSIYRRAVSWSRLHSSSACRFIENRGVSDGPARGSQRRYLLGMLPAVAVAVVLAAVGIFPWVIPVFVLILTLFGSRLVAGDPRAVRFNRYLDSRLENARAWDWRLEAAVVAAVFVASFAIFVLLSG
jgi:Flp pilus assembly protein TadB